ncbi:MAG: ATP-dependent DNA ligase [Deltaproteobacteria bacterium HGW-Deltaproteobacteria-6]|nr:MAG: ATP-dependent DNA ligase [Deltaproteobacteria bacterium HGW-Deltaproteobacteria-6]
MNRKAAQIAGRNLSLSNLEKVLYPSTGFTKAHVLEYYRLAAPFILPHLADRALTLKRYPDGVANDYFFEKRCPVHRPSWVATAEIARDSGGPMTVCLVNDLDTLMWVENLAALELHVPLSRAAAPENPDAVVFDLDPGPGAGLPDCLRVALILRDLLAGLKLACIPKTSGMKGLHVLVPLNHKETTFDNTKKFSKSVAQVLERNYPDLVTSKMAKEQRIKKVFINWSQNDSSKTIVCVYSLRAGDHPTVSFPLAWKELEHLESKGDPDKIQVEHAEAISRLKKSGDLFAGMLTVKQRLPYL